MLSTQVGAALQLAALSLVRRQILRIPPGQCVACADWPETVVQWPEDDEHHATPDPRHLAGCGCGFKPLHIRVRYADAPLDYLARRVG